MISYKTNHFHPRKHELNDALRVLTGAEKGPLYTCIYSGREMRKLARVAYMKTYITPDTTFSNCNPSHFTRFGAAGLAQAQSRFRSRHKAGFGAVGLAQAQNRLCAYAKLTAPKPALSPLLNRLCACAKPVAPKPA